MTQTFLPLLLEPAQLDQQLSAKNLLIVDLCRAEIYAQGHVPGAVSLDFAQIISAHPPAMGMLPSAAQLSEVLSAIGMTPTSHVVAYDDEANGRAARLLWTLDAIGHPHYSLLNGGLHAWMNDERPISTEAAKKPRGHYTAKLSGAAVADKAYIMDRLGNAEVVLLDTRSPGEYHGEIVRAARGGHIPGAVNFDWMNAMDQDRDLRLKPPEELRQALSQLGVTSNKEVIAYCQTHHRSAHTYIVLKSLGFTHLRGYPGSWSEWGNSPDAPIE